jgi:tetraacyldisaccharide 4'-kinase
MTEKDAVKCERFAKQHHWVLPVDATLSPELVPELLKRLKLND